MTEAKIHYRLGQCDWHGSQNSLCICAISPTHLSAPRLKSLPFYYHKPLFGRQVYYPNANLSDSLGNGFSARFQSLVERPFFYIQHNETLEYPIDTYGISLQMFLDESLLHRRKFVFVWRICENSCHHLFVTFPVFAAKQKSDQNSGCVRNRPPMIRLPSPI